MLIKINNNKFVQLFSEEVDVRFSGWNWDWEPKCYFFNLICGIVYTKRFKNY